MKNLLVLVLCAAIVLSCQQPQTTEAVAEEPIVLPFEVTYKGTAEIGSRKNVQTVMEWNKRLSEKNFDLADLLADSVMVHLADGTEASLSRDSTIAMVRSFIEPMDAIKINYTAAVPVNNADAKHEWVFSWTEETYNFKDGKSEHTFLHEDYRLENGKIREVFQYARKEPGKPVEVTATTK